MRCLTSAAGADEEAEEGGEKSIQDLMKDPEYQSSSLTRQKRKGTTPMKMTSS